MATIGFIGMGNMGSAILKGALQAFAPEELVFTALSDQTKQRVWKETGVPYALSNAECANNCKYLILAVKPQYYDAVLKQIHYVVTSRHVVISLAPGITSEKLKEELGADCRIIRAMPNTPAAIGEGMTGLAYNREEFSGEELAVIEKLFGSIGKYEQVEERLMSAVVCASGSSPAFVYMFIEALADGAVRFGMPRDKAYAFAAQAVAGAAKMVMETGEHPGSLKDKVCSPGGTTIAGVAALEEAGFRSAVMKACAACFEKSEKLG
ncbi:MAG: pyrroline-5-carboxylate reductase [Lachnospiraceae bacterium]|nr:pyrroline-5-carboxylate reductase [Lachnospiraceae bacterium]